MKPIHLPRPQELKPGTRWDMGPRLKLVILPGKHGNGDLNLEIRGSGSPTHEGVCLLLLALMQAEDRYWRADKTKKGGEYLVPYLAAVVHWFRAHRYPATANPIQALLEIERDPRADL